MNNHAPGTRAGLTGLLLLPLSFLACEETADSTDPRAEGALPVFGTFRDIEPPSGDGAAEPWLSVDGEERVILSWLESSPEGHALRFSIRHAESWGPVRTVVSRPDLFVNWADFPSVIRLPDGSLAAHWLQRTGAGTYDYGVRIARSTDEGTSWSDPVTPHTDGTPTEHGFVSLFPGAEAGAIGAVWLDGRNYAAADSGVPFMTLRGAQIGEGGSLEAERVLDPRTCDCCQTGVARSGPGLIVAYRGRTESEVRDIRVVRGRHDTWSEPLTVHEDGWTIESCPVNGPAIGASGDRVAVAWFTAANDSPRVLLAWSDDAGVSFGAPREIAGPGEIGEPLGRVDLEVAPEGHVVVSWLHEREGTAAIMLAAVAPNGERAVTTAVPRLESGRAIGFPRLAVAGQRAVLAWTEPGDPSRLRLSEAPVSAAHWSSPKNETMVRP